MGETVDYNLEGTLSFEDLLLHMAKEVNVLS
jgi:hypothetical protein